MVCGLVSEAIGFKADRLGLFVSGACSGVDLAGDPREPSQYVGIACGWASSLLEKAVKPIGILASLGCTFAPSAGNFTGGVFESKHELDAAIDIVDRGECLKYSPSHFGSPWLAVRCARNDPGFASLPAAPVLGRRWLYPNGAGYGTVSPATIFFGGDPTSLVEHITWTRWGGQSATGSGIGDYVWPGESVAVGSIQTPAEIVAWDLGSCRGHSAYRKIDWYFPQYGQTFDPNQWMNVCTGAYSPTPTPQSCGDVGIQLPPGYATDVQALGIDCSTALSIVGESPSVDYLYQGEARFQTAGLNCGTEGFDVDLSPPTLFECAFGSVDIIFEVTDTSG